jgi:hypothetical protein
MGIGCYICKVYNYHDSQACGCKRSGILPRIVGMVVNGVVLVKTLLSLSALCAFLIILCDIH